MSVETETSCLYICMGSACHQLGVYEVLPILQRLLLQHHINITVELKGAFCLGPCSEGIVLKYRDHLFKRIRPQNIEEKFINEILPYILNESQSL